MFETGLNGTASRLAERFAKCHRLAPFHCASAEHTEKFQSSLIYADFP